MCEICEIGLFVDAEPQELLSLVECWSSMPDFGRVRPLRPLAGLQATEGTDRHKEQTSDIRK